MKNLLIITQYFYPENFRINDLALTWREYGYNISILTGLPNYPKGIYFDGYKNTKKVILEEWEGMQIIRLPMLPRGKSAIDLSKFCFSFVYEGKKWVRKYISEYKKNIKMKNSFNNESNDYITFDNNTYPIFDLIFTFEVSPMTQALIAPYLSKKMNNINKEKTIKTYLYVQDLWPENVEEVLNIHNPLIIKPIELMVSKIYKETNYIFATSKSFVKCIEKRLYKKEKNDSSNSKVHYWPQYAEDFYIPKEKMNKDDTFKICFTGNIGYTQGLGELPIIAKLIKEKSNNEKDFLYNKKIKFVLVGDGRYKEKLIKEIEENDVKELFDLHDKVEAKEIPNIISTCDMCLVSFTNSEVLSKTIPSKLQSYMACGMPIIAIASGETKNIIEEANCGYVSSAKDYEKFIDNIKKALNDKGEVLEKKGKNAREYFLLHFSKKLLLDKMEDFFNKE
ncbi:MAG: glycosyltransferase family 4 protein [Eubacteriales bacterium]|nr:glycosyltransferase family 4 protein [Eubacteriales bacterium]